MQLPDPPLPQLTAGWWPDLARAPPPDDQPAPGAPARGELRYVSDLEYVDQPAPPEPVWTAPRIPAAACTGLPDLLPTCPGPRRLARRPPLARFRRPVPKIERLISPRRGRDYLA
jgi:hypothetical protein